MKDHDPDVDHGVGEHGNAFWYGHRRGGGGRRLKRRMEGPPEPDGPESHGPVFPGPGEFGPPFRGYHGGPPPFGPWSRGYGRRGGRAKRGDVRAAALAVLAAGPLHRHPILPPLPRPPP